MNPISYLESHPNAALTAVVAGSLLLLFFATWLIHYYVRDVRDWWPRRDDGIRYYRTDPLEDGRRYWVAADDAGWAPGRWRWKWQARRGRLDLPGPDSLPAPRAGEYHDEWDDWQRLDPDAAADQLTAEWHAEPRERVYPPFNMAAHIEPALVESLTDDPDLLLWDIRCQVTRIREIRAELADLKRELCAA